MILLKKCKQQLFKISGSFSSGNSYSIERSGKEFGKAFMSEKSQKAGIRHIHKQMKAVCSLIQPEYRTAFEKIIKILELQLILQELTQEDTQRFQASSIPSGEQNYTPCDLTTFIRAVAPVCTEDERAFLHTLQNTEQTFRMLEQFQQIQNVSKDTRPEDLMMQFMTPGQQKAFQQFDAYYSKTE